MTGQLVLSKEGCAHWYFLAASPVVGGAENRRCVVSAVAVSDDTPELTQQSLLLDVPCEAGLAALKKMLVQLQGNRGFKEV